MAKAEVIKRPIKQLGGEVKQSAWMAIIESLALIILGILFIVLQDKMVQVLAYIFGVFFVVKGGFQIINYFIVKGQKDFFNNDLLFGVISVLVGVVLLVLGEEITNVFRIIVGIVIIYESLVRINSAIKLANAKVDTWKSILVLALIMLVIGIFVTFNSGAVITLIGALMIVTGIIGIIGDAMFIQDVNTVVDRLTKPTKTSE